MPDVEVNGHTITIERFRLTKATRVMTLLQKLQQEVPEVSRAWATFRNEYRQQYQTTTTLSRIEAVARWDVSISEEEWERAGQQFTMTVPAEPNPYEVFFQMAPLIYEQAEELTLRLLGLIAMPNETVKRYVEDDVLWQRVDEYVQEKIADAPLEDIMELVVTTAEVIDKTVLQKARSLGERAGNVARLLGIKTSSETSTTSSEEPVRPSTVSVSSSPGTSDGPPTESSISPGTPSTPSRTSSQPSMTSS